MPRKVVEGNIIQLAIKDNFDVIIHGCNCHHVMGAGLAAQIAKKFPEVVAIDKTTTAGYEGKLGTISFTTVGGRTPFIVVNAYTQFYPGRDFRLEALTSSFSLVRRLFYDKRIAYPRIGAGIGGGDWEEIEKRINRIFEEMDHTLVEYKP